MKEADMSVHTITGAYGYSGRFIAERLLKKGITVKTLTNSPNRKNPFSGTVEPIPFNFDNPDALAASLEGTEVLYNTYWVRFNHSSFTHEDAVQNTQTLFRAAKKAGVRKIVHVSITNPSEKSDLEYFKGKGFLESSLINSGMAYSILRPAVLFGNQDILINNIAWALRKLPVFGIFGDGTYRIQPMHVEDFADLAVLEGFSESNRIVNAIGPETFTYLDLVKTIGKAIQIKPRIIHVPPYLGDIASRIIGSMVNDVFITPEEIKGLMQDLLYVEDTPQGKIKLSEWAAENSSSLGVKYSNELGRRRDRINSYETV
jgi:nucleoside-diphosphate-sugar epimerase